MIRLTLLLILFALPAHAQVLDIRQVKTDQGITAWFIEDHSIPLISIKFGFDYGSAHNPIEKQGLSQLLSNTLDEGAGPYEAKEFQQRLNDRSITLSYSAGRDAFTGTLKTLVKHKLDAFSMLKSSLTEPLFPDEAITRMVDANMSRIKSSLADPEWIAARLVYDKAFEGHPYARNSGGTLSTLSTLTRADLQDIAAQTLTKDKLHVAVTGAITEEELKNVLNILFSNLPDTAPDSESDTLEIPAIELKNQGNIYLYKKDIEQSFIEMVWPGISQDDPRYFTSIILNHILGGSGFGSILTEEIREKRGLTYGIYSYNQAFDRAALFRISSSTAHQNAGDMMKLIHTIIKNLKDNGVTEDHLKDAKSYLRGSMPLRFTSSDQIASIMLGLQMEELGQDYFDRFLNGIEAVSNEDIIALADEIFANPPLTVLVGQPQGLGDADIIAIEDIPNAE